MNSNMKNTTVKFTNQNGKKSERVESHCAKPTMSFYQKLAKSEISTLIGTKKPRFNIEWESKFRSDRFRGLEKHTVMVDGKIQNAHWIFRSRGRIYRHFSTPFRRSHFLQCLPSRHSLRACKCGVEPSVR